VGRVTLAAPLNVPALLGEDASELYASNQYHLLELFMKDNIITIDWTDEVLSRTCLTHAGKRTNDAPKLEKAAGPARRKRGVKSDKPTDRAA
jgi:NAD(P) transhydrogenase subunit alpha